MKILRVKFDNIIIFNNSFDIDFTAQDRITQENGVYKVWNSINTQQVISIIGINAVGKTTSIKLLNMAMEIVLNNKGLNEVDIPMILLNEITQVEGIIMTIYFYKENKIFELKSNIKYKTNKNGEVYLYYEEEVLKVKNKTNVKSKTDIFNFKELKTSDKIIRTELQEDLLKLLKDDDSISIMVAKNVRTTLNTMLQGVKSKLNQVSGVVDKEILNVFDDNLKKLEKTEGEDTIDVEFKNSEAKINLKNMSLEDIISSGTIKGQRIIKNALIALKNGGYLLIDELENHLNKELVKMVINIFNNKDINKNGACLVFTTHYAEILDSFDRKDNIYVLTRDEKYFTNISRYSDLVKRNELKKSEVILSNFIKGTAPKALNIRKLEEYICKNL